jgi:predicted phosphodiesterase
MRFAVLSDIHANLEAFQAVLADMRPLGLDAAYSLGDNVGYGAEPDGVIAGLAAEGIPSVLGNHELAVIDPAELDWFNPIARESLVKTVELLSETSLARIHGFPRFDVRHGCRLVHGFPPDSPTVYQFQVSGEDVRAVVAGMEERICFTGHTHFPEILACTDGDVQRWAFPPGTQPLKVEPAYIINVGSVGQPRDGSNCAKYAVFDTEAWTVELRHVPYDIESAVRKILAAGLPPAHAYRLR